MYNVYTIVKKEFQYYMQAILENWWKKREGGGGGGGEGIKSTRF